MNYHDYFNSYLAGGRDKNRRKVKGNTYAERLANGNIGLRYHATMVCEYWPNGNVTLRSGGWQTVTTQARINDYSPARVYSHKGSWAIYHSSDGKTPAKIRKCRVCHGTGVGKGWWCPGARSWTFDGGYRQIPEEERVPCEHARMDGHPMAGKAGGCYRCDGSGQCDYGNKPIPTPFYDGIVVDMGGKVISKSPLYPAVSAQYDAPKSGPSVSGQTILDGLSSVIPALQWTTAKCPQCGSYDGLPVTQIIMHVNDVHQWSRGQIADWLDTLDADLSFVVTN